MENTSQTSSNPTVPVTSVTAESGGDNSGSGQNGGGTVSTLPVAQAPAGAERSRVHDEAPDLARAAMLANQAGAPTDPVEQMVAALHTRVAALESEIKALSPDLAATVSTMRTTVDALVSLAEKNAPMFDKLWHLFNVHWAGKVPGTK